MFESYSSIAKLVINQLATSISDRIVSQLLVEKGADVNVKNKNGWTPLRYARYFDNTVIEKILLEAGAIQ